MATANTSKLDLTGTERYVVKYRDAGGKRYRVVAMNKPLRRKLAGAPVLVFRDANAPHTVDKVHMVDSTLVLCVSVQQQDKKYGDWHVTSTMAI